jgi:3-isopropylmalate/(R)-2-methylmalate dehydratase large subunit
MLRTLFEKIWQQHLVVEETQQTPAILYIDTHLIHEVTSPQAFQMLRDRNLKVRNPQQTFATCDHSTPTSPANQYGEFIYFGSQEKKQVKQLEINCIEFDIPIFKLGDNRQGIIHVIGPELGITQPGSTIVCGDSHTSTHGAFGALAFGVGTSEVGHVFATQCILQKKPKTFGIEVNGELNENVTAKDVILYIIQQIGIGGATGHVIEYFGSTIKKFSMEQRMTVCNMSIEAGAKAGLIAPDEKTFEYLKDKEYSPTGESWKLKIKYWQSLYTDPSAKFDKRISLDATKIEPMITYGTNPEMSINIGQKIPKFSRLKDETKALNYMGFNQDEKLIGKKVDVVFIGSCTNSRISDLREAANIFSGNRIAKDVRVLIVPGSHSVKQQAEKEGLAKIFIDAGAEWREPGCSMCLGMNGDIILDKQVCVSTSNRNFEGRQGKGGRTLLASPITAAAAAIYGVITDPREIKNPQDVLQEIVIGVN